MARAKVLNSSDPLRRWTIADALDTYNVARWGCGYFGINEQGNVVVTPRPEGSAGAGTIDMKALIDELTGRGIQLPILLRFSDILRSRIELLNSAFNQAIKEADYKGQYRGVYPIKVNQNRTVVEEIIEYGRPWHYGLEAGSKPELLAIMAIHQDEEALVVCNGYKDDEYIETALLASKLGRTVILVIEKPSEVDQIRRVSQRLGVRPILGIRARLSSRGAGRWEQSGGDRAKFGLSAADMVEAVKKLEAWGELDCLQLIHFHLGSQISAIRSIKNALREGGRLFVELHKMGATSMRYFDIGGGLGVDYDGSQTNFASSMNYSVQEYANDVVYTVKELCDDEEVPHPTLVSESGRAVAAHHSVLVVNVLGVTEFDDITIPRELPKGADPLVVNMSDTYTHVNSKNLLESYHDAVEYKDQVLQLFNLGHLSLADRVMCEQLFWGVCQKILSIVRNFSMFQSVPDSWAVDQLFPIVPIHRLNEEPTRRATLADITCDSDGKIDSFIDLRDVKHTLELHPRAEGEDYYLGIFLVGAYQEILGDLHNLFGDTNTVHVSLSADGHYEIKDVVAGDTVAEVLRYVDYEPSELLSRLRNNVEVALRKKLITLEESRTLINRFRQGMISYTYLEKDS
jgi:arginine decarboxylase